MMKRGEKQQSGSQDKPSTRKKSLVRQASQKRLSTATSVLTMMTISFYICWTPYAIYSLLTILGVTVSIVPSMLALLFAKSGVVVNPIIYIFFNKEVSNFVAQ